MKGVTAVWVARNRYAALDSSGKLLVKSSSHEVNLLEISVDFKTPLIKIMM